MSRFSTPAWLARRRRTSKAAVECRPSVAIAVAFVGVVWGACSRDSISASDDATVRQTTDDGGAACTSTIDGVLTMAWTGCPATFSTDPQLLCRASLPPIGLYLQTYGDLRALWWDWGTHGIACFYDATGARVGVLQYDDVLTFCNGRSSTIVAGQTADLPFSAPRSSISCPAADAGTMDSAISGGAGTDGAAGGASPGGGMKGNGAVGAVGGWGAPGGGPGTPVHLSPLSFLQPFDFDSDLDYQTSRFASVTLADVDGDGILDVVAGQVPQAIDSSPVVMRGNGDGTFGAPIAIDSIVAPSVLLVGDLNGDGSPDLAFDSSAAAGSLSPGVTFALNNGDGTFGIPIETHVGYPTRGFDPTKAYFGDLNGDGLADFAALQSFGISVSLGAGDGTFAPAVSYSHGAGVPAPLPQHNTRPLGRFLATGDSNGDGHSDFVVSLESGYLSFVLNLGDGTFGVPTFVGTAGLPDAIALTDLDADGNLDPIVGEENLGGSGTVTLDVFSNEGGATFAPPVKYPATTSTDVRHVDLNGDGLPDVWTARSNIYLNDGHGKLADAVTLPVTIGGPIAFGDVNGDGKTDIVIGAFRHVHVLLNTSP